MKEKTKIEENVVEILTHPDTGQTFGLDVGLIDVHPHRLDDYYRILAYSQPQETSNLKDEPQPTILNLIGLSFSLMKVGQTTPIMVRREGERYLLLDGLYRFVAIRDLIGSTIINAAITDWTDQDVHTNPSIARFVPRRSHYEMAKLAYTLREQISRLRGKKRTLDAIQRITGLKGLHISAPESISVNQIVCLILGLPFKKSTLDDLIYLYEQVYHNQTELKEKGIFEKLDDGNDTLTISRAASQLKGYLEDKLKRRPRNPASYLCQPVLEDDDPRHQMILGDARTNHHRVSDNSVNLVFTSFEYMNEVKEYDDVGTETLGTIKSVDQYTKEVVEWCGLYRSKLTEDGHLAMVVSDAVEKGRSMGIPHHLVVAMISDGWTLREDIVWHKTNNRFQSNLTKLQPAGEHILVFSASKGKVKFNEPHWYSQPPKDDWGKTNGKRKGGVNNPQQYLKRSYGRMINLIQEQTLGGVLATSVFNKAELKEYGETTHPCPFPWSLACLVILLYTDENDLVLDFGAGIGSTAHAAKILNRRSTSIELRKVYFDYLENRMGSNDHEVLNEQELSNLGVYLSTNLSGNEFKQAG
jgi:site-specific DNA-methyltransferase (adenine-specific)